MTQETISSIRRKRPEEEQEVPRPYEIPCRPAKVNSWSFHLEPEQTSSERSNFDDSKEYRRAQILYMVRHLCEKDGNAAAESTLIEAVRMIGQ